MEEVVFTLADGSTILGAFSIPVYWTMVFGKEEATQLYQLIDTNVDVEIFRKIRPTLRTANPKAGSEHFIIYHDASGKYTIQDRNKPPLTYLNNTLVTNQPVGLKEGDVIVLPIVRNNTDHALYIQVKFENQPSPSPPIKQLFQCSKSGQKFIVTWEEDPNSRRHFAIKSEQIEPNQSLPASTGSKNLRASSEIRCPYCGNLQSVFCTKCNSFICYDGFTEKLKCAGCKQTYKVRDQVVSNFDIKTI